jgi:hypothetical protein
MRTRAALYPVTQGTFSGMLLPVLRPSVVRRRRCVYSPCRVARRPVSSYFVSAGGYACRPSRAGNVNYSSSTTNELAGPVGRRFPEIQYDEPARGARNEAEAGLQAVP